MKFLCFTTFAAFLPLVYSQSFYLKSANHSGTGCPAGTLNYTLTSPTPGIPGLTVLPPSPPYAVSYGPFSPSTEVLKTCDWDFTFAYADAVGRRLSQICLTNRYLGTAVIDGGLAGVFNFTASAGAAERHEWIPTFGKTSSDVLVRFVECIAVETEAGGKGCRGRTSDPVTGAGEVQLKVKTVLYMREYEYLSDVAVDAVGKMVVDMTKTFFTVDRTVWDRC